MRPNIKKRPMNYQVDDIIVSKKMTPLHGEIVNSFEVRFRLGEKRNYNSNKEQKQECSLWKKGFLLWKEIIIRKNTSFVWFVGQEQNGATILGTTFE